jgi:hypothetical protein
MTPENVVLWDGSHVWMQSIVRAQRWADPQRDQRVAIVMDAGSDYLELRGLEILGSIELVSTSTPPTSSAAANMPGYRPRRNA